MLALLTLEQLLMTRFHAWLALSCSLSLLACTRTHVGGTLDDGSPAYDDSPRAPLEAGTPALTSRVDGGEPPSVDASLSPVMSGAAAQSAPPDGVTSPARYLSTDQSCPRLGKACGPLGQVVEPWRVLLRADDYGAGSVFYALSGSTALLRRTSGVELILSWSDEKQTTRERVLPIELEPRLVAEHGSHDEKRLYVLGCRRLDIQCELFLAQPRVADGALLPLPASDVAQPLRGLVVDPHGRVPCVYDRGLSCLRDGRWQPLVDPAVRVHSFRFDGDRAMYVDERGRLFLSESTRGAVRAPFVEVAVRLEQPLGPLYRTSSLVAAGKLHRVGQGAPSSCEASPSLQAAWTDVFPAADYALTADHVLLYNNPALRNQDGGTHGSGWCEFQTLIPSQPAIAYDHAPCQDADNPRVLTPKELLGPSDCFIADYIL